MMKDWAFGGKSLLIPFSANTGTKGSQGALGVSHTGQDGTGGVSDTECTKS